MKRQEEQMLNPDKLKEESQREILKKYFPDLPFIHFTVLKVRYNDGSEHSTNVESLFQKSGATPKTQVPYL